MAQNAQTPRAVDGAKDLPVLAYALSSKCTLWCIPGASKKVYDIDAALGGVGGNIKLH